MQLLSEYKIQTLHFKKEFIFKPCPFYISFNFFIIILFLKKETSWQVEPNTNGSSLAFTALLLQ